MEIKYEIDVDEKIYSVSGNGCFAKCKKSNPDYGSGGEGGNCYATCSVSVNAGGSE